MEEFPEEICGLWIDEEEKAIYITKVKPQEFRVAIIFDFNKQLESKSMKIDEHLKTLFARWILDEQRKINRLQVEAGIDFLGPTYNLYLSMVDNKPQNFKLDLNVIDDIRLYPEVQMGLYDDWEEDLGVPWGFPYKNYQKATSKIEKKFKELVSIDESGIII